MFLKELICNFEEKYFQKHYKPGNSVDFYSEYVMKINILISKSN